MISIKNPSIFIPLNNVLSLKKIIANIGKINTNPVNLVDEDGNLILDEGGNPIIEQVTVTIRPALSVAGAAANSRFNTLFAAAGSHANYLSEAEKSLLWQWLDIGAQYANSPFYSEEK